MRDDQRGQAFTLEGFVASVVILTAMLLALQSIVLTPTTGGAVDQQVQDQLRTEATDILQVSAGNVSDANCPASDVTESDPSCPEHKSHDLSYIVRHWNGSETEDTWAFARGRTVGYGSKEPLFHEGTMLGNATNGTFASRGYVYNIVVEYRDASNPNRSETRRLVYRGVPSNDAVTTEFTITLYDNQTLTGVDPNPGVVTDCVDIPIEEIYPIRGEDPNSSSGWDLKPAPAALDCYFPIPEAAAFDDDDQGGVSNAPKHASGTASYCSSTGGTANCADERDEGRDSPIYNVIEIRVIVW